MKNPKITIIGIPNTGKSTLFNRLINKRKALIHNKPGMTRDVYKHDFELDGKHFILQDTGGFFEGNDIITEEINKRILIEAENSDIIIFLFDGRRELLDFEKELFLKIKRINNNVIPVINKVDNHEKYILPSEYYSLKEDFIYISAEHKEGLGELINILKKKASSIKSRTISETNIFSKICVVGKPNVGKSSFINRLLNDDYIIVSPLPGTTRDSIDVRFKMNNKEYLIVDNAGIRKLQKVKEETEAAAIIRAEKNVKKSDIVIFMLDISRKLDRNDTMIANIVLKSAKPVIIAANKWDLVKDNITPEKIIRNIRNKLNAFYFSNIHVISSKSGKNIHNVIKEVDLIEEKLNNKIRTKELIDKIKKIINQKKLYTEDRRLFKPKYISIETYRPFFINFYFNSKSKLRSFDEIYLKKRIIEEFNLKGIPIFFKITNDK